MRRGMPLVRRQIHVEPQALSPDRRTDGDRPCYGVSRAGEVLFAPLREHFKVYAFKSCRETPIVPAILGNDAGIYGSVRLIVGE